MAYKKDVDDMRESPSLILYELLQKYGAMLITMMIMSNKYLLPGNIKI